MRAIRSAATLQLVTFITLTLFLSLAAHAQSGGATEQILYLFNYDPNIDSGEQSVTSLTFDAAGNLYGSTIAGGIHPGGTVFELTNSNGTWTYSILYNFGLIPGDGYYSASPLLFDANGNLYGTTQQGGAYGYGTVFELIPSQSGEWTEKLLYSFQGGLDGAYPQGNIALDSAGNIYGTTLNGGSSSSFGTVFEVAPTKSGTWHERLLHKFTGGLDGELPWGGVTLDSSANLFGTTIAGGADTHGVVFEFVHTGNQWQERVIHSFTGAVDVGEPYGNLIFDTSGNLYGTTVQSVFEMIPTSTSWRFHTLYTFSGNPPDPSVPFDGVVRDSGGNLYGTSCYGGVNSLGTVFEVSPSSGGKWTMQVLHNFSSNIDEPTDGYYPKGGLILDPLGNLYGTTNYGGYYNSGTVFEVTP